jgi:hypothetical protein
MAETRAHFRRRDVLADRRRILAADQWLRSRPTSAARGARRPDCGTRSQTLSDFRQSGGVVAKRSARQVCA